jgi:hypothetical protein
VVVVYSWNPSADHCLHTAVAVRLGSCWRRGGQGRLGGGGGGGLDDEKSVYYPVMLVSIACKSHLKAINVSHGSTGQQKRLLTHVDGLCVSACHRGGEHLLTVPWAGLD